MPTAATTANWCILMGIGLLAFLNVGPWAFAPSRRREALGRTESCADAPGGNRGSRRRTRWPRRRKVAGYTPCSRGGYRHPLSRGQSFLLLDERNAPNSGGRLVVARAFSGKRSRRQLKYRRTLARAKAR
jgi:hypothetical protein